MHGTIPDCRCKMNFSDSVAFVVQFTITIKRLERGIACNNNAQTTTVTNRISDFFYY